MRRYFCWTLLAILFASTTLAAEAKREPLIVFAASSLTDVLQHVANDYTRQTGTQVKLSFAGSSALAKQIESGAKADVFLSADQEWMDYLEGRALIDRRSRFDLLGNTLVLIAPSDSDLVLKLGRDAPLSRALGAKGKLATGDPESVPVGKYAKAALTSLNVWSQVQARIARTDNVRVALMYVARGETPLGIVYATDAAAEPKVKVIDTFPANSHPNITYPVALTTVSQAHAKTFVAFLRGPIVRTQFEAAGFNVLGAVGSIQQRSSM